MSDEQKKQIIQPGDVENQGIVPRVDTPSEAPSGRRQAFRDLRREMTNEELTNPGVVKLLLDELEQSETANEELKGYVERYHAADKRAAVLDEKLKTKRALDIYFGVGVGLGGTLIGLSPVFWDPPLRGWLALIIGALLIVGGIAARMVKE